MLIGVGGLGESVDAMSACCIVHTNPLARKSPHLLTNLIISRNKENENTQKEYNES